MKTRYASLLSALLLLTSLTVSSLTFAQKADYYEQPTFQIGMFPNPDQTKIWLNFERYDRTKPLHITLRDAKNTEMYDDYVSRQTDKGRQCFDMSQLADGLYTFTISDGKQIQERSFRISTPGIRETLPQRQITMR
ncbi:hypothetical protein [Spirosoma rhododendri]|uniref:Secretion system C-terminal sorting domain-containing protein n=1 Tax=Spirosoma rhododendri TaxID=2728024 RepID=A0A7L5DGY2_9BACT|nr:hypothetical protein [Spirosoma rhododendri]QJD77544.1 hypothetical protein HH216_03265 [Spirosoma rhododendri]